MEFYSRLFIKLIKFVIGILYRVMSCFDFDE